MWICFAPFLTKQYYYIKWVSGRSKSQRPSLHDSLLLNKNIVGLYFSTYITREGWKM